MFNTILFNSELLANSRTIWLIEADEIRPDCSLPLVILLDGEYYIERMEIVGRLRALTKRRSIPAANYAFVSHVDDKTRWRESFCHDAFANALAKELIPLLHSEFAHTTNRHVTGGLSLTGLAAAHAALAGPFEYDGVIAQSASFWWSENWLTNAVPNYPRRDTKFRMCCGNQETEAPVDHGDGLIQSTAQIPANEMMRDALEHAGFEVDFQIYHGGHRLEPWAADLPDALRSVLPS